MGREKTLEFLRGHAGIPLANSDCHNFAHADPLVDRSGCHAKMRCDLLNRPEGLAETRGHLRAAPGLPVD
jgi:hypothetical protein